MMIRRDLAKRKRERCLLRVVVGAIRSRRRNGRDWAMQAVWRRDGEEMDENGNGGGWLGGAQELAVPKPESELTWGKARPPSPWQVRRLACGQGAAVIGPSRLCTQSRSSVRLAPPGPVNNVTGLGTFVGRNGASDATVRGDEGSTLRRQYAAPSGLAWSGASMACGW